MAHPRWIALVAVLALSACVHRPGAGPEGEQVTFSLQNLTCQSCGYGMVELLQAQPGVAEAQFDPNTVELTVRLDRSRTDPQVLLAKIQAAGEQAVLGSGQGTYSPQLEFEEDQDVQWIAPAGEAVELASHLADGKVTVFDYYATWCGPCREVDEAMRDILSADARVALRKINVVDWESPVARAHLKTVEALPYVVVYDAAGRRVAEIAGLDLPALRQAIEEAKAR